MAIYVCSARAWWSPNLLIFCIVASYCHLGPDCSVQWFQRRFSEKIYANASCNWESSSIVTAVLDLGLLRFGSHFTQLSIAAIATCGAFVIVYIRVHVFKLTDFNLVHLLPRIPSYIATYRIYARSLVSFSIVTDHEQLTLKGRGKTFVRPTC